jgi:hypothetical protein
MKTGALSEKQGAKPAPAVTFPIRSGGGFFRDLNGNYTRDKDEPEESVNLFSAITFAGKTEGRAVVVADGDFVSDNLVRNVGNMLPFVDTLRWLVGEEDISGNLSSEEDVPIQHTREQDKIWFYLTTFAAPLPIAGIGLLVARKRRRKSESRTKTKSTGA